MEGLSPAKLIEASNQIVILIHLSENSKIPQYNFAYTQNSVKKNSFIINNQQLSSTQKLDSTSLRNRKI